MSLNYLLLASQSTVYLTITLYTIEICYLKYNTFIFPYFTLIVFENINNNMSILDVYLCDFKNFQCIRVFITFDINNMLYNIKYTEIRPYTMLNAYNKELTIFVNHRNVYCFPFKCKYIVSVLRLQ